MAVANGHTPSMEDLDFAPGDLCETLAVLPLRRKESPVSELLADLPAGLCVQLLELGSPEPRLRARVLAGRVEGWATVRAPGGRVFLQRKPEGSFRLKDISVGGRYEVNSLLILRAGEHLDSELLGELGPGTAVEVLDIGRSQRRRAKLRAGALGGWSTVVTSLGQLLLGKSERVNFAGGKVREVLELARAGDATAIRALADAGPLDLDCSDLRGRTPLMYAASVGARETVAYLLSRQVQVNALDDVQKTALHYAASADVVKQLVAGGAMVDARDQNGCTPLMRAAAAAAGVGVLEALLEAGGAVNAKDFEGRAALHYARNLGREAQASRLAAAGAEGQDEEDLPVLPVLSLGVASRRSVGLRQSVMRRMSRTSTGRASVFLSRSISRSSLGRSVHRKSVLWTVVAGKALSEAIAVEEPEDAAAGESAAKERALSRLRAITAEAEVPRELEGAIEEAVAAGAGEEPVVAEARLRAEALRERASAHDALLNAIVGRCPETLRAALVQAEQRGVPGSELERARAVLAEEEPKQRALERLGEAQESGDSASLRAAITAAADAGILQEQLVPFEELLRGAESKEESEEALEEAIEERDVVAMRFALEQAQRAGADVALLARGQEALKQELPRHEVRELMAEAHEGMSEQELSSLLERARDVGMPADECLSLEALLLQEQRRQKMLEQVRRSVVAAKTVDWSSMGTLALAREQLASAVQEAHDSGVQESELRDANLQRRRIHNAIQDLKGAIRVFCRVRPLSRREKDLADDEVVFAGQDGLGVRVERLVDDNGKKEKVDQHDFTFDAVFAPSTQEEVFEECRDLVQSALDGYGVTIFAYGQTGAGKTFTMYGAPGHEGTAPRTIRELFRLMDQSGERFTFTVMGSMMELYRNELVDLLVDRPAPRASNISTMSKGSGAPPLPPKLKVNVSKAGVVQVEHLIEEECSSVEELLALLERGNSQRTVAATAMNSESSRSHLLVAIRVVSVSRETGEQVRGKILMCDLAGSERLKKSEVSGDMQKEAIEINRSLTALGNVVECLTKGKPHVPYRDHTLTQVMQDALGGSSKTLMFVNCSPAASNSEETLMALKYATRAKRISNDPRRKTKV